MDDLDARILELYGQLSEPQQKVILLSVCLSECANGSQMREQQQASKGHSEPCKGKK